MPRFAFVFMSAVTFGVVCSSVGWTEESNRPASNEDEPGSVVGVRPYELDWANRNEPGHPQLVDFEDLTGWRVRCFDGADAHLFRSRQELLFGQYTAKLAYSGTSAASRFVIEPSEPVPIPGAFTGVNLWVRGNNWGWVNPPATARVGIRVLVRDAKDEEYRIDLGAEDFDYWSLMHATCVSPNGVKRMYESIGASNDGVIDFPARLTGIEVSGCSNKEPARLYFDALSFYEIQYPALTFDPIPENLPWPTTPDTILPTASKPESIRFSFDPASGTLGGITVEAGGQKFQPCWNGAITFEIDGKTVRPGDEGIVTTLIGDRAEGNKHVYEYELKVGDAVCRYRYAFEIKNKSYIVDVITEGDAATQCDIGLAQGLQAPKAVFIPYLTYGEDWPRVICSTGPQGPIFLLSILDYYNSDASELFGAPRLRDKDALGYAGGALYRPTTAGKRNPMRERLFINVSSDVHEVLPNIPNPNCDTGEIAREYLWRNIGANFQNEMLQKYKAYGIDKFIACHHEVGWRESGESFTLRDRPAPGIGDEKVIAYSAFVRGLGYRFGTYTNYVDFAPVNANWDENAVCLDSDGQWQKAWPRTYALKPLRAAEKEAYYAPRINERYGTSAQYCDVHTAYTPWGRTDYDARTPGAGMFRTQFNAFARLLSNESKTHKGPVFSEGNYHWFYAGIVDGDYATMVPYGRGWQVPHIVDFDLLKMHPKMTDFGMGMPQMYYGTSGEWTKDTSRLSPWLDRFITATIAFGHIGFLTEDWGFDGTLKSYYMLQALQQRYAMVPVKQIQYFDGEKLVDTSTAIAMDAYKRQQICTEYENGLTTWCNLSFDLDWKVEVSGQVYVLPPAAFAAFKPDDILAYSATVDGQRHEFVRCKDYVYLDSRDQIVRTATITARATVAVKQDGEGAWWIVPATQSEEVTIALDWLGVGHGRVFAANGYALEGDPVESLRVLYGIDEITVMPPRDARSKRYRLSAHQGGEKVAVTKIDLPRRTLIGGSEMEATVTCVGANVPKDSTVKCGYADGFSDSTIGFVDFARVGELLEAKIPLHMPKGVLPNTRYWYRSWPQISNEVKDEDLRWLDLTAVAPFDLSFPSALTQTRANAPCIVSMIVKSNIPGLAQSIFSLHASELSTDIMPASMFLAQGETTTVQWPCFLPRHPVVAKLEVRAERREGEDTRETIEQVVYLQSRPTKWVVADLTKTPFTRGVCFRGRGESEYEAVSTGATVEVMAETSVGETLDALFTHPPYIGGVGYAFARFPVKLPEGHPKIEFAMGFRSGSTSKDGCVFKVIVIDEGKETEVFSEQYATLEAWARRSADLSSFAGKDVTIKLVTDVGPADDSYSDWAAWGAPRVVMDDPAMEVRITSEKPAEQFGPPPDPLAGITRADLATIVSARITFDSAGVNGGEYTSYIYFNGVKIGAMPSSGSDTQWGPGEIALPKEALSAIGPLDLVTIKNPGKDYMKVRNLCLRFELTDGRRGSSCVDLGPYTSAKGWEFDEGTSVAVGEDLPEMALSIPVVD